MARSFIVTIDGPAAAGKGTVAYLLARRYGFLDIDSGALFRAVAWLARRADIPLDAAHEDKIVACANQHQIELVAMNGLNSRMGVRVDGKDISNEIRTETLTNLVPKVSALPKVRQVVKLLQHKLADDADRGVIIEGRDTGTAVFPEAQLKFFLTASVEERAQRRHADFVEQGREISFDEVYSDLVARDQADIERTHSPLTKPVDAILVDTSGMSIEEVVERLGGLIDERFKHIAG